MNDDFFNGAIKSENKSNLIVIDSIESMAEAALALMSGGCLPTEVCAELDLFEEDFEAMQNPQHAKYSKVFHDAMRLGAVKCKAYWYKQGRLGVNGEIKGFSVPAWLAFLKENFGWQDKQVVECEHDTSGVDALIDWFRSMSPEERAAVVEYRRAMIAAKNDGSHVVQ